MDQLIKILKSQFKVGLNLTQTNLEKIGPSLVIAPHADDESIACGGTIALLTEAGFPVYVLFITDGSKSHPTSKRFPTRKLRNLREKEATNALNILGVPNQYISFLRLPDSKINELTLQEKEKASLDIQNLIKRVKPQSIFIPWRNDPHPDHIASWKLLQLALESIRFHSFPKPQILEYLLWFWERTNPSDLDISQTAKLCRADIKPTLLKKQQAIHEHQSQLGLIIDDDPQAFTLPTSLLEKTQYPEELFLTYEDHYS